MKKIICLIAALSFVLISAAIADSSILGTWYLNQIIYNGEAVSANGRGLFVQMNVREDGKAETTSIIGETKETEVLQWSKENDNVIIGDNLFKLNNGMLWSQWQGGITFSLGRNIISSELQLPKIVSTQRESDYWGSWTSTNILGDGILLPASFSFDKIPTLDILDGIAVLNIDDESTVFNTLLLSNGTLQLKNEQDSLLILHLNEDHSLSLEITDDNEPISLFFTQAIQETTPSSVAKPTPPPPIDDFLYASNGTEVRINAYSGTGGHVIIPDEIDGLPVTQIADGAFLQAHDIQSLTLPRSLVIIHDNAFSNADISDVLILPDSVETVGYHSFHSTALTGLVIHSDCEIKLNAFTNLQNLGFIYIAEGCSPKIASSSFSYDRNLTICIIPASVQEIADDAFTGCNYLKIVTPSGSYAESYAKQNFIICDTASYDSYVARFRARYDKNEHPLNTIVPTAERITQPANRAAATPRPTATTTIRKTATPKPATATPKAQYTIPPHIGRASYVLGTNTEEILEIKKRMQVLGYFSAGAELSGNYNSLMQERIRMFQADFGLKQTGLIDKDFLATLYGASASQLVAKKQAAEKEKNSIQNYKSSCKSFDYTDVARNPGNYKGKRIKASGRVIQVMEGLNGNVTLRVRESNNRIWYVTITLGSGESRILENDRVTVYGICQGVTTYETVLGASVTIPKIEAKYIDIN